MATQYLRSRFSSLREYLTPISHTSTYASTGEITPEEFVMAGNYLVYRFPTWQWSSAPEGKERDFLPLDKQFLVTKHVPCYVRVKDYEREIEDDNDKEIFLNDDDDNSSDNHEGNGANHSDYEGWTQTGIKEVHPLVSRKSQNSIKEHSDEESVDINDIDDLIDETADDDVELNDKSNIVTDKSKRNYDLYISYSTSYRVPKMYLVGYDAEGSPLTPKEMFEDISSDYRHKTVTIEKAPFLSNTTVVSIHPCRHATVMKVLMKKAAMSAQKSELDREKEEQLVKDVSKLGIANNPKDELADKEEEEEWEDINGAPLGIRVDQYLVVFLKFISSVIPGIEHDYTMEAL